MKGSTLKSPITADTVALAGVSFSELRSSCTKARNEEGAVLYYCERDPANAGKTNIQALIMKENNQNKTTVSLSSSSDSNVRSAVHEYGGGAYCCLADGSVLYTDFPSHDLYQTDVTTKHFKKIHVQRTNCRFADFVPMTNTGNNPTIVICIMEDHTDPAPANVQNSIVALNLETGTVTTVASGHDFYACPQLTTTSSTTTSTTKLAYIAWDHPNMPWDTTFLYIQSLDMDGLPQGAPMKVDQDSPCSKCEPRWCPSSFSNNNSNNHDDDSTLVFLSDVSGWYNFYEVQNDATNITPLHPKEADFCSGSQGWILGLSPYIVLKNHTIVACYNNGEDGDRLVCIPTLHNSSHVIQEFGREYIPPTSLSCLCATDDSMIYFVGGSITEPPAIWSWDGHGVATKVVDSIRDSTIHLKELQSVMSEPRLIQFPSQGGVGYAFGYYYPPTNRNNDETQLLPPLLVKAHGGPTSQTSTTFRLVIQFWTSRGFAVLDVDYGGSTGYGKEFRQSLQGKWGIVDVNDVCAGANYCVQQGWVNPQWLCIDGSSAGGYTTLAALTFENVFSAGASLYGVSDLSALAEDTHKFESRYLDGLVGKYPQDKAVFEERCPILFTEKLNCPILLLQGTEDKIVPPNQAERMFEALKEKGLSTSLVLYKGEQHGFRKKENIRHSLNAEYSFFCQVFGIEPEEGTEQIAIGERIEL